MEVWYSVRGVRCIGFVSREGLGRESMNAVIQLDDAVFDGSMSVEPSASERVGGMSGRFRLGPCHNPRRDGDDQQSSFRIPSREVDHSSASGRWVRGGGLVMFLGTGRPRPEIPADVSFMHFARAFLPLRWHFVEANLDRYVRFPTARKFYRGTSDIYRSTKKCCPSFFVETVEWHEAALVRGSEAMTLSLCIGDADAGPCLLRRKPANESSSP